MLVPLCTAVVCLGPYGVSMLTYPFAEARLEAALDWNLEWLPPYRAAYYSPHFVVYVCWVATLWGAWFGVDRARHPRLSRA
jgi:hypothetical protein